MTIEERLLVRIPDGNEDILNELSETVSARLCIRLGVDMMPDIFEPICADATVKMYRRIYYEGITSESAANLSISFADDVLAEYAEDINAYLENQKNQSGCGRMVRLL